MPAEAVVGLRQCAGWIDDTTGVPDPPYLMPTSNCPPMYAFPFLPLRPLDPSHRRLSSSFGALSVAAAQRDASVSSFASSGEGERGCRKSLWLEMRGRSLGVTTCDMFRGELLQAVNGAAEEPREGLYQIGDGDRCAAPRFVSLCTWRARDVCTSQLRAIFSQPSDSEDGALTSRLPHLHRRSQESRSTILRPVIQPRIRHPSLHYQVPQLRNEVQDFALRVDEFGGAGVRA
ncbi:hypothetical protein FA15DRAFT_659052 [Coprinopsis marcescibilis]|uniref:Uncharacterized protein n=1 Tax=Coprinopsis marcescibilis TaxID=230819 RepID=A0A5C3KJV0_COPMA|nr:hypothetical protein FA15DRAFT_659052 [Coprinopsis marcescibilis]